ncbi:ABC transporter ATP-binding protein [Paenibacillus sp. IHBB 3054]|uniref:ABC transporter ATP-binding protein n=1 Tax=Paenibacillus sp. IHBB 3054 TaxID=3425689 RepID=UPI003F663F2E
MNKSFHNIRIRLQWVLAFKDQWANQRKEWLSLIVFKVLLLALGMITPLLFKLLVDEVMVGQNLSKLWYVCGGYAAIYIAETVILGGQTAIGNKLSNRLTFAVRLAVWSSYMRLPFRKYEQMNTGDLKARMDQDVESVNRLFKVQALEYAYSCAMILVGAGLMIWFSWKLALFGLLMVPVSFWITRKLGKGARKAAETNRNIYGQYEGWLQTAIQGWREIKANHMEKRMSLKFTEYWHAISKSFFQQHMYWFGNRALQAFKDFFITRMNLYFIGGLLILHGEMTIGSLLVFMKYYEQMFTQLGIINDLDMKFTAELPGLEKVQDILEESPVKRSRTSTTSSKEANQAKSGILSFNNVSFKYSDMTKTVLRGVSFDIEAGTKVAIVGRSGSGKSTIVKLLLGMYEPEQGNIQLSGKELRDVDETVLHRTLGVVMQDPAIFNMSIQDNVRLARPKATVEEIRAACRLANMDEFITKLPQNYDTVIGEKGVQLSGGQKQRLAMARVLLSKAEIILLDEATSMLDHESETEINRTLDNLSGERTMIIVAHRLSSVMRADHIILLEDGCIADRGSHSELWSRNELYRTLFQHNMQESV